MTITIGLVANVFQEANVLPGWLETHTPFFDDVRVVHAGPGGERSTDGTIELLEKWHIPIHFMPIDDGFGVVRTKAVRTSPCDYVVVLDADERFFPLHRVLECSGESTPHNEVDAILQTYDFHDLKTMIPNWENVARLGANLRVGIGNVYNQWEYLRETLESNLPDALLTVRRHWHDFSFRRPTQNWLTDPDWQLRVVRNSHSIYYAPCSRMHERLDGAANICRQNAPYDIYFDHFHFTFKRMEVEQRAHDIKIYDKIHAGERPPSLEEFSKELMP